jgi:hypothetical protein
MRFVILGAGGVLSLGGEHHQIVRGERDLARVTDRRHRQDGGPVRVLQPQAVRPDRVEVGTAGDEHDVVAVLEQATADHPADAAGPQDHEAHQADPPGRVGTPASPPGPVWRDTTRP